MNSWDQRFLDLAEHISKWSKDPSTQVGAVIVDNKNRVVSVGFNGFPRGICDEEYLLKHREAKYARILHAEQNAMLFADKDIGGCTLYVYPFMPCNRCALEVIQKGITRVVSYDNTSPRFDFELTRELFSEADVALDLYNFHGHN
jgi:dCMP deaminase